MEKLKQKIISEGMILPNNVLELDSFINQQIDPLLMQEIGKEFAFRFRDKRITKVLTIESSGIAPALMTALELGVPLIFARKKQKSLTKRDLNYVQRVHSFTKQETNEITVSRSFLTNNDNILIIDDFLAYGESMFGLAQIIKQAGAYLAGIGIIVEKTFQNGSIKLRDQGYRIESLVQIASLDNNQVQFH